MAEQSPFGRLFNPSGSPPDFFAAVGSAMGLPTNEERYGALQGNAMRKLSEIQSSQGLQPQQTIMEFMKTPEGMQLFQDPRGMEVLKQWVALTTAPTPEISQVAPGAEGFQRTPGNVKSLGIVPQRDAPTMHNVPQGNQGWVKGPDGMWQMVANNPAAKSVTSVAPGNAAYVTGGGEDPRSLARNPTAEQQNFDYFAGLGKIEGNKLMELAQMWAMPQDQRPGMKERAIGELISGGHIDQATGQKLLAEVLQIKPVMNAAGENTGMLQIIDMSRTNEQGNGPFVSVIKPTENRGEQGAATPTPDNPKGIKDPAKLSMFLGSGIWPASLGYLQGAAQNVLSPNVDVTEGKGGMAKQRQQQLDDVRFALTLFPEGDGKTNMVIKAAQDLLKAGFTTDSLTSVRSGIRLYDIARRELNEDSTMTVQNGWSKDQVVKAQRRMQGWSQLLRALPDRADMVALERGLIEGKTDVPTAKNAPGTIVRGVWNSVKEGYNSATGGENKGDNAPAPTPAQPTQPAKTDTSTKTPPTDTSSSTAPAKEAVGVAKINEMPVAALLKLDPQSLSPPELNALQKRVQEIKKQRGR